MENVELLEHLKILETELHQFKCPVDSDRLDQLVHDSFIEFGSGGAIYSKQSIIEALSHEDGTLEVWSQNYSLQLVKDNIALVLYQSAHKNEDDKLHRFSNRSSYWIYENSRWQICFHQGTLTDTFNKISI